MDKDIAHKNINKENKKRGDAEKNISHAIDKLHASRSEYFHEIKIYKT